MRRFIVGLILLTIFGGIQVLGSDEPSLIVTPSNPTSGSTVTFTVNISEENVSGIWLEIQECNGDKGICYPRQNISMQENNPGTYQLSIDLKHDDATYIQYTLNIETTSGWKEYFKENKVNLSKEDNASSNNNDGTPGFEIIGLLAASLMTVILLRRRR